MQTEYDEKEMRMQAKKVLLMIKRKEEKMKRKQKNEKGLCLVCRLRRKTRRVNRRIIRSMAAGVMLMAL
jgi:hypothetical protein